MFDLNPGTNCGSSCNEAIGLFSSLLSSSWVCLSKYLTCLHLSFLGEKKEKSPTCKCIKFWDSFPGFCKLIAIIASCVI